MATPRLDGKVLVTGASGFIGGRLVDTLLESGSDVVTVRRAGSPESARVRSVVVDYSDKAKLESLVAEERPNYVLHVAGVTKGRTYEDFSRGNVMPTRNLLDALSAAHPTLERFVLLSSLAAYGPSDPSRPKRESDSREPIEHYGKSKLEAEQVVEGADVPWTIIRPGGVYGPGDVDYFNLFQSATMGVNTYFGNRQRAMSLVYVDDCVSAVLQAAQHTSCVNKGYFIETTESVTWEELQERIVEVVGCKTVTADLPEVLVKMAARGGEIATCVDGKPRLLNRQKVIMGSQAAWTCSAEAARTDFGFQGEVDVTEGIRRTHAWYAEHGWYQENRVAAGLLRGLMRGFGGRVAHQLPK